MSEVNKEKLSGRILVIDDETSIVEVMRSALSSEGYEVDTALSGLEGVQKYIDKKHDIVFTDLRLGDILGTEVLARIKLFDPQASVIIVTGYATTESAVDAIRLGASDYLTKPVRISELYMIARSQMAARQYRKHIKSLNSQVELERDKLRNSVVELTILKELANQMMFTLSYDDGLDIILNSLVKEINADAAFIYILGRGDLLANVGKPISRVQLFKIQEIIKSKASELLNKEIELDINIDEVIRLDMIDDESSSDKHHDIVVPLMQENLPYGVLVVSSFTDENFINRWSEFIENVSSEASKFLSHLKLSIERQKLTTSAIVEHTLDGIILVNLSTNEILLNPRAKSYFERLDSDGIKPSDVENELNINLLDIYDELKSNLTKEHASHRLSRIEIPKRDSTLFLRLNASLVKGLQENEKSILLVLHDITQERSVEEMKTRLVANISHELRTPTAVVKEFAALLLDGIAGQMNDNQLQYLNIIQSNILRLSRLIENLLTLSRSDTGGFTIILQAIELAPIIENVSQSLSVKLQKKNIELCSDVPSGIPMIYADKDAVTQILTNLIENAYKYSPENTEVNISVKVKGARIEIAVSDQGYGISAEEIDKVFKPFHRLVDQNDPKFQEGVGLGLPVVRELITRHGGDIWVESAPGSGSTFTFSLQIAEEDNIAKPA